MMSIRLSSLFGSVAMAAAVAATACSGGEAVQSTPSSGRGDGGPGGGGQSAPVPVTIAKAVQKSMPIAIQGIGTVIAASTVSVHAQITGEMTAVNFKEGEDVEQGQVLVTLDRRPLEAALQQAQATLDKDAAQAANARAQAARYEDLLQRGIAAQGPLPASAIAPTDSGAPSRGRVNFIDNAVDPTTGTIKVKGTFPNEDRRLWPGQFVNVTVTMTADTNAIVVPTPAVQTG